MQLTRIVYLSEETTPMSNDQVQTLVDHCHESNARLGVSGLLLHSSGNFMQVLEGDDLILSTLYAKIAADPRHRNVRTLLNKPADRRLFPEWGMQLADPLRIRVIDQAALDKTMIRLRLSSTDPAAVETQALSLLDEFRRQLMKDAA